MIWIFALRSLLFVALVVISPYIHLVVGHRVVRLLARRVPPRDESVLSDLPLSVFYLFGLLVTLSCIFFLKLLGAPWLMATTVPVLLAISWTDARAVKQRARYFFQTKPTFTQWLGGINFVLWTAACLATGATLFQPTQGIHTIWYNNYGDLAFHLGMIDSFTFGDNWPPQYHLFPGQRLSYPFFINLWSSSLWWIAPIWQSLPLVFLAQWLCLWWAVFGLLGGSRNYLLPWALLLGGGGYQHEVQIATGPLIERNMPWTVFLTSVWVTQRSALFGVAGALAVVLLTHRFLESGRSGARRGYLVLAGALLALMPLAHTHAGLVVGLFVVLVLGFRIIEAYVGPLLFGQKKPLEARGAIGDLLFFLVSVTPSLVFVPWLIGKKALVFLTWGWSTDSVPRQGWVALSTSAEMWWHGAMACFLIFAVLWCITAKHRSFIVLSVLFIAANGVILAVWPWDQIKIFITLYAIFLAVWAHERARPVMWASQILPIFLIIPGAQEAVQVFNNWAKHEVYSVEAVQRAASIRRETDSGALIAAAPDHNSLITLTGRKIFLGYEGTLSSHAIDYRARKELNQNLEALLHCREKLPTDGVCPDYLLWTAREQQYWHTEMPPSYLVQPTALDYLFWIKG